MRGRGNAGMLSELQEDMTGTPLSSRRVDAGVFCLVCLLGAILHSRASPPGELCENPRNGSPSCVCEHANGIIDLSPLALQNGSARCVLYLL